MDTRRDGDLLIIARTDARAEGFEAAIERATAYRDAGADVAFVEARPRCSRSLTSRACCRGRN